MKVDLKNLVNENVQLINATSGKSIAFGCVQKIEINTENQLLICFYNNKENFVFKNIFIQYLIL